MSGKKNWSKREQNQKNITVGTGFKAAKKMENTAPKDNKKKGK